MITAPVSPVSDWPPVYWSPRLFPYLFQFVCFVPAVSVLLLMFYALMFLKSYLCSQQSGLYFFCFFLISLWFFLWICPCLFLWVLLLGPWTFSFRRQLHYWSLLYVFNLPAFVCFAFGPSLLLKTVSNGIHSELWPISIPRPSFVEIFLSSFCVILLTNKKLTEGHGWNHNVLGVGDQGQGAAS